MTHPIQKIREAFFQLLFTKKSHDIDLEESLLLVQQQLHFDEARLTRLKEMLLDFSKYQVEVDQKIAKHLSSYDIDSLGCCELAILQCGAYELIRGENPPAIVISEAIRIFKKFAGPQGIGLINGVLDSIRKESLDEQH